MVHVNLKDIEEMDKIYRLNLINSCTGYKSANLIATKSHDGITNVAVFSSVTHMGSNPAMLGFVVRPTTVPRNTFDNLIETKVFTVNHIHDKMIEQAHQTAAKYEGHVSEFNKTGLTEEYLDGFYAPFVKESEIKLGCRLINRYEIKENDTIFIVAAIENIYYDEGIQMPDGWLRLDDAGTVAINGLDGYSLPKLLDRFHYARPEKDIKSFFSSEDQNL